MRNRLIIVLLTTALLVSVFFLIICKLNSYKGSLWYRLYPLEAYRLGSGASPAENGFWIIGDSRAADWPIDQLDFIGIPAFNLGIRGQSTAQVKERFSNDLERSRPCCVLIQVGINDLKSMGVLGKGSITRNCILNVRQMLEECEKREVRAIYTAILPPGEIELFRRPFWDPATLDSLVMVNAEIREFCRDRGFLYFDSFELLEDAERPGKVQKAYQSDFLHINTEGYRVLSEALRERLSGSELDWVKGLLRE
jgi:lysophospholipase L1-like esterase